MLHSADVPAGAKTDAHCMVGTAKRAFGLVAILAASLAVAGPAGAASGGDQRTLSSVAALNTQVLASVNQVRVQHGLVPLTLSVKLSAAALQHSSEMAKDGYFTHESHDGTAFWQRVQQYYGSKGFPYWSVGENLVWAAPDLDASGAIKLWLGSPEHRANLLAPRWREVGLAAVHVTAASGVYSGQDVTIITADFGVRH
jgi:uncharacterized protein YkwD